MPVTVLRRSARAAAAAALALILAPGSRPAAQSAAERPRLLVMVVVDQMRADYLRRLNGRFTGGFRRLLDEGAVFDQAYYPYLNTVTCAGHATIGTGALPKTHGAIMNQWFDRATDRVRTCTADPTVQTYVYGESGTSAGHSAAALRIPTMAARLQTRWPAARVVTMSMKPRSAVMLAGTTATAVTWFGDAGGFESSTAFGPPRPEVTAYVAAHPYTAARNDVWQRLLPVGTYTGVDDGVGERPDPGWTRTFPHPLAGTAPPHFVHNWEESPWSDAWLGPFAEQAIRDFHLGDDDVPDVLGVSFSATDLVGHSFGPDSHEVQDTLLRLDRVLGALLTTLDATVGRGRYALALSADHGVARVPEASVSDGQPGGRIPFERIRATVDGALAGAGPGPHVRHVEYTQVYLTPAARATATATTVAPALTALRALPGVAHAVWNGALGGPVPGLAPALLTAIRDSYDPERSGDISVVPAPGWIFVPGARPDGGDGTTHGSPNPYDQHVPLIFLGRAFAAGHHATRVSPADLAPTLAATIGLPVPGVEGRALMAPAPK